MSEPMTPHEARELALKVLREAYPPTPPEPDEEHTLVEFLPRCGKEFNPARQEYCTWCYLTEHHYRDSQVHCIHQTESGVCVNKSARLLALKELIEESEGW